MFAGKKLRERSDRRMHDARERGLAAGLGFRALPIASGSVAASAVTVPISTSAAMTT